MLLALSVIGILLSVILLYFNAERYPSSRYLGLFFLGVSLYGMYHYVMAFCGSVSLLTLFIVLIPVLGAFTYIIGPLFYWYFRSVLTDSSRLRKSDIWHFIPMVVFFLTSLPFAFGPYSEKVDAARLIIDNFNSLSEVKPSLLSGIFSFQSMLISRPLLILLYAFWAGGILLQYKFRKDVTGVYPRQHYVITWLSLLLGALIVLLISHILRIIELTGGTFLGNALEVLKISSIASLALLLISPFFFPGILYGLPRFAPTDKPILAGGMNPAHLMEENAYKTRLGAEYIETIARDLMNCMQVEKAYLRPDCNISLLSKQMNIPAHHLAVFFRDEKKETFTDYRNSLRVNHAIDLIRQGKASDYTMEAIGVLSGFSSRNAFFSAFRKVTGTSPGAYACLDSQSCGHTEI
ncbi:MAG: AraC family transcriptional regulator [Bacteroidales bacterium]|nr:AraC family transcriptional regulator [Bacteroidales bacterium]